MSKTKNLYPTEDEEQMVLARYLDARFGYYGWIHVPNQRWAKPQYLRKLAEMGVKKGFPDILIFENVLFEPYYDSNTKEWSNGMAIELKRVRAARPTVKKEQLEWLANMGVFWMKAVAYGAKDAIEKIEEVYGKWGGK